MGGETPASLLSLTLSDKKQPVFGITFFSRNNQHFSGTKKEPFAIKNLIG